MQKVFDCNQKAKGNNAQSPSGSAAMGVLLPISITFVKLLCRLAGCAYSAPRSGDDLYYIGTFCGHLINYNKNSSLNQSAKSCQIG
jgi:hypothetical protein